MIQMRSLFTIIHLLNHSVFKTHSLLNGRKQTKNDIIKYTSIQYVAYGLYSLGLKNLFGFGQPCMRVSVIMVECTVADKSVASASFSLSVTRTHQVFSRPFTQTSVCVHCLGMARHENWIHRNALCTDTQAFEQTTRHPIS